MFATATLAVGEQRPALLVPKDAIVLGGFVPVMVWAVGEGNRAEPVPVTLGVAVDDLVEVLGPGASRHEGRREGERAHLHARAAALLSGAARAPPTRKASRHRTMDLVAAFVRNPVKISVGVLLVLLFGMIAFFEIPVQLVPGGPAARGLDCDPVAGGEPSRGGARDRLRAGGAAQGRRRRDEDDERVAGFAGRA